MLRLKSFKFEEEREMNTLLENYRLAAGAQVFVSNGLLIIPYEDGEMKTNAQKIIHIKEQKNIIFEQLEIILHSQKVLNALEKDAKYRVDEAKANLAEAESKKGKDKYDTTKGCEEALKNAQRALTDLTNQKLQNEIEILRLNLNCELFDERIIELNS